MLLKNLKEAGPWSLTARGWTKAEDALYSVDYIDSLDIHKLSSSLSKSANLVSPWDIPECYYMVFWFPSPPINRENYEIPDWTNPQHAINSFNTTESLQNELISNSVINMTISAVTNAFSVNTTCEPISYTFYDGSWKGTPRSKSSATMTGPAWRMVLIKQSTRASTAARPQKIPRTLNIIGTATFFTGTTTRTTLESPKFDGDWHLTTFPLAKGNRKNSSAPGSQVTDIASFWCNLNITPVHIDVTVNQPTRVVLGEQSILALAVKSVRSRLHH
ncbi:uncharacterized protein Z518_04101 [Rhinocladiella mackenziei CBS 650.93]|uniref:Uncharacterized protein n=1 Tax=Rhinocladiella mackenziei CBS 650.93 TaxID=1442369 RepID=A0A0D2FVF6_9EURO|nr:uncharacterized protein Z518_04101 [Rhinocladiella mackenziei CBS 650.93]KIX06127.1 hypothetical protein Z518_04101 [Rhinocladiella mackenziei CBS 650.93]